MGSLGLIAQTDSVKYAPIRRQIVVKGDQNYPPYEFINDKGEPDGFNVDLFKSLAEKLGVNFTLTLEPWTKVRKELEEGKIDVIIGMLVTAERAKKINFGTPHSVITHGLFTYKDSPILKLEDLKGKSVVVQEDDVMHDFMRKNGWADTLITVADPLEALDLINDNVYDAALLGSFQGVYFIKQSGLKNVVLRTFDIEPYRYAMGVKKGDSELLWLLNAGLYQLKEDGTYDKLYNKWFSVYEEGRLLNRMIPYIILVVISSAFLLFVILLLRKKMARVLLKKREIEDQLSAVSRLAPIGVGWLANHQITMVNAFMSEMTGYSASELVGNTFQLLFKSEEIYLALYNSIHKSLKENGSVSVEAEVVKKSGKSLFVMLSASRRSDNLDENELLFTMTDISRSREALMQARVASERLNFQLDNSPLGHVEFDREMVVKSWSAQAELIFGWTKEEVIGHDLTELNFIHPDDVSTFSEGISRLSDGIEQHNVLRFRNYDKNGVVVNCVWYNSAVYDDSGVLLSVFCLVQDESLLRQAELLAAEKQERLKWFLVAANVEIWELNVDTGVIDISDSYAAILGYTIKELQPLTFDQWKQMVHPDDRLGLKDLLDRYLAGPGGPVGFELRLRHKDGHYIYMLEKGIQLPGKRKGQRRILGIQIDVSGIKNAEEEIRKLSVATDQSPASVVMTDVDGNIEYINRKFIATTGYSFNELKGKKLRIFRQGHLSHEVHQSMWKTIHEGSDWRGEHKNRRKNKEKYWESVLISPIRNNEGQILNYVIVSEDITERKRIENELIVAKEKAEESDRLKSSFLNNLSHEVRTPLNAIVGFSEIINTENVSNPKMSIYVRTILESSRQLLLLMDNIINISMIETEKLKVIRVKTDLNQLLNDVYNQMAMVAGKKNVVFRINSLIPRDSELVMLDQMKIGVVLNNLISNSLKFTDSGMVQVTCRMDDFNVYLEVQDTGVGIPESIQKTIFERFAQGNNFLSGLTEGIGLGLPIVKAYVELMGGTLSFTTSDSGTTFKFSIPFNIPSISEEQSESNSFSKFKSIILVVDDLEINSQVISEMISGVNVDVLYAPSGQAAIDVVAQRPDIDLVLMDLKMPGMSGLEATREIKKLRPNLPVIAQTAYTLAADRSAAMDAGCDDYIAKPIIKKVLIALLKRYLN
jgi:PAS domain S-box-containing protein